MITFDSITKTGGRAINEDCIGIKQVDNQFLFVLADGLGGHNCGEVASNIVVNKSLDFFNKTSVSSETLLSDCFITSQNTLMDEQQRQNSFNEMKTTMVALSINDKIAQWAHIGDSRLYYFQKDYLSFRTLDHSVPQMLVTIGEIQEKDIRFHEDRNRLLRVMGIDWDKPKYDVSIQLPVKLFASFLLCSDGFWELISEKYMSKPLKKSNTPEKWLSLMEQKILTNGQNKSMDNYSAIAVFIR